MSDSDITNKALVDLWMHQNRLMWDRLNTLGILQIAMLGAAYGLSAEQWSAPLIFYTLVSLVAYTITLWHRSDVDRCVREKHSLKLKKMGLDVRLDLTNEDDMKLWDDASYLAPYLKHFGSKFYMSIIFGSFIIFDLGAEAVLMYRASLH